MSFKSVVRGKWYAACVLGEFVRHFSNWAEVWDAYKNGRELPALRLRNGLTLLHGPVGETLYIFREVFEQRVYTGDFYRPTSSDVVIDIGANIGVFAIYLNSLAPGIKVHCFEPARRSLERLSANVRVNGLDSTTLLHPYAVSDRNGPAYLAEHEHSVQRALLRETEQTRASDERVETVTLAKALELCDVSYVDFLKIDIEGAEVELVLGSEPTVWRNVKRVALEFHETLRPGCCKVLTRALLERGYDVRLSRLETGMPDGIIQASRA